MTKVFYWRFCSARAQPYVWGGFLQEELHPFGHLSSSFLEYYNQLSCDEWAFLQNKSLSNQLIHQAMMSCWWLTYGVCRTLQCLNRNNLTVTHLHIVVYPQNAINKLAGYCMIKQATHKTIIICPNNPQVSGVNALFFVCFFFFTAPN